MTQSCNNDRFTQVTRPSPRATPMQRDAVVTKRPPCDSVMRVPVWPAYKCPMTTDRLLRCTPYGVRNERAEGIQSGC
jgi:hypothetical protein